MSKLSRSEQARLNGAKSNGPRTEEGRRRCGQINLTHGAYAAAATVLDHEDGDVYAAMWAAAYDQYRPANTYEGTIVDMIVDHLWHHQRLVNAANVYIRSQMNAALHCSPAQQSARERHMRAEIEAKHIEVLERRARHHAREHARAIKTLMEARKQTTSVAGSQNFNEIKEIAVQEQAAVEPARLEKSMRTALWTPPLPKPASIEPEKPEPDPVQ
jgi:hypothetical protein